MDADVHFSVAEPRGVCGLAKCLFTSLAATRRQWRTLEGGIRWPNRWNLTATRVLGTR